MQLHSATGPPARTLTPGCGPCRYFAVYPQVEQGSVFLVRAGFSARPVRRRCTTC